MKLKNAILPGLALAGLVIAATAAMRTQATPPSAQPVSMPAPAPYDAYVSGGGIVEADTDNISVGASLPGIVSAVYAAVGDRVRKGDPLFLVDDREQRADLAVKQAALRKARAALEEAKASHKDYQTQFAMVRSVTDRRAVSAEDVEKRRNAELLARAKVESAQAGVEAAQADLDAARTALERLTVRAPVDGEVIQVSAHPGEYAPTGVLSTPLVRMGGAERLHVRVDIDENDAWRFRPGTRATASLRGNADLSAPLRFVRVEPYVTPKTSLTGSSTERVDTRVLQAIYAVERSALPVYVGQQVDVFIEAPDPKAAEKAPGAQAAEKAQ